jgi:hypothetical protein
MADESDGTELSLTAITREVLFIQINLADILAGQCCFLSVRFFTDVVFFSCETLLSLYTLWRHFRRLLSLLLSVIGWEEVVYDALLA